MELTSKLHKERERFMRALNANATKSTNFHAIRLLCRANFFVVVVRFSANLVNGFLE